MVRVGLISDTHGLLRPQAIAALAGCDRILHAGDVGEPTLLGELAALTGAPVLAVSGNCDDLPSLPTSVVVEIAGRRILLHHGHLPVDEAAARADIVVTGHTHVPRVDRPESGGPWRVNPGSAGPRRFRLPTTVAVLALGPDEPVATLVELDLGP